MHKCTCTYIFGKSLKILHSWFDNGIKPIPLYVDHLGNKQKAALNANLSSILGGCLTTSSRISLTPSKEADTMIMHMCNQLSNITCISTLIHVYVSSIREAHLTCAFLA